jgi:hypothetical protein
MESPAIAANDFDALVLLFLVGLARHGSFSSGQC